MYGGILDAVEADIYDLYNGKKSAIKLAADVAITILKVDQVFIHCVTEIFAQFLYFSKPASGSPTAHRDVEVATVWVTLMYGGKAGREGLAPCLYG